MLNQHQIIGRLTADPKLETTNSGITYCKFTVVTNEYSGKGDDRKEHATFHNVTAWRQLADNVSKYMSKGKLVYVDGSIRKSDYEKDGVKQYYVETVARDVKFLSPKSENGSGSSPDTSFDVDDFADV